ncbi:MAG TPA: penicillin-binding transpeptidase domain-containing protein [Streptosporangiaceae bacterium]|nr:penicillin-binding transpeptidase domain-containing protein [Streptosporangiaceae bacterium]
MLPGSPGHQNGGTGGQGGASSQRGRITTSDGVLLAESTPVNDASYPSYDPNALATHNATKLDAADKALRGQAGKPLLNRAINLASPPGATFNVVTSSVYLTQTRNSTPQTGVAAPTQLPLPQTTHVLTNRNGETCGNGNGHASLLTAFAQSCDTAFGGLGLSLGAQALSNYAELFGMNSTTLQIPMPVTQSSYAIPPSRALTAFSAVGQFSDTVIPLQEAMLAAAIANRGTLMRPYLVKQVATANGSGTVETTPPTVLSQPVSAAVADAVVTCYAPYDNPQIAVGVIIQGGGYGAAAAAPIAVQTINAYLASRR